MSKKGCSGTFGISALATHIIMPHTDFGMPKIIEQSSSFTKFAKFYFLQFFLLYCIVINVAYLCDLNI